MNQVLRFARKDWDDGILKFNITIAMQYFDCSLWIIIY